MTQTTTEQPRFLYGFDDVSNPKTGIKERGISAGNNPERLSAFFRCTCLTKTSRKLGSTFHHHFWDLITCVCLVGHFWSFLPWYVTIKLPFGEGL